MHTSCLFCGNSINLIFVHGHYQCPVCKTNALPCCDGDNCNNAFIIQNNADNENTGSVVNHPPPENLPVFKKQHNK
jgi:hypothetical protein